MTSPRAQVVADSVNPWGDRLTTFEVVMHRFMLAEFNTHRVFSRNSASSRAIPFRKQVERVLNDPAVPVSFPAEQRGMQGGDEIADREAAEFNWLVARDLAVTQAKQLADLGVHKSVVNRVLEPYMWHTVIVSATDYSGFFEQRCSPLAQPEIRLAAEAMRDAYDASTPAPLDPGQWHRPYVDEQTEQDVRDYYESSGLIGGSLQYMLHQVSAARCARVSYLTHDGVRDIGKDLDLYARLVTARPGHWSPLEHVATPHPELSPGNFNGWYQLRHIEERR
jgi:thymidylate synthase ThyX